MTPMQDQVTIKPSERMAYTMRETAEILGVSYQTLWRLSQRGLIRSSSALRTKLFSKEEINRFLRSTTK